MKYLSLFSGIGGFELGITQAYESNRNRGYTKESSMDGGDSTMPTLNEWFRESPTCIGYSEIDKYAISIYQKHFPNHKNYGDITKINADTLPDFDLLVGGFPCQSFSIAGKRGGFDDTRGTLFFEIARILGAKRPRLLLLENVKGLLSHDNGKTFYTIISTLDELGYDLQWQVLNSKNHGVPQNRERVFIIGHLRGTSRPEVFPFGEESSEDTRRTGEEVSYCLDSNYAKGTNTTTKSRRQVIKVKGYLSSEKWDKFNESSRRVYDTEGISPTIPTVAGGGHTPKISVQDIEESLAFSGLEITEKGYESLKKTTIPVLTPDRTEKRQNGRRFKEDGDESFTLTAQDKHGVYDGAKIRRLTPTECERLQGFPDGWTEGISDSQRYKCLGNAVTVNVIHDIVEKLLPTP